MPSILLGGPSRRNDHSPIPWPDPLARSLARSRDGQAIARDELLTASEPSDHQKPGVVDVNARI
jgi:hypothetical protein